MPIFSFENPAEFVFIRLQLSFTKKLCSTIHLFYNKIGLIKESIQHQLKRKNKYHNKIIEKAGNLYEYARCSGFNCYL